MSNSVNQGISKANEMLRRLRLDTQLKKLKIRDAGVAVAFIAAISLLLFAAGYVIMRLESDRIHRAKWHDYNDCGWA